ERLTTLKMPIPDPNPVALARAQQLPTNDRSILGKMFGMFKSRPSVPTETTAVASPDDVEPSTDSAPGLVRGGTRPGVGTSSGSGGSNNSFNVDPKAVDDKAEPAKKPR